MMRRLSLLLVLAATSSFASQFSFTAGGHTYTVTTQAVGVFLTFGGHWMYEPSMITPSAATNNEWVMLFNSNRVAGIGGNGSLVDDAIFMVTSSNGTVASGSPTPVLYNSSTSNVCDMVGAKPIWDGSHWHVYVQAAPYPYNAGSGECSLPNFIAEATGPSLTQLSWVKNPGTNNATVIIQCNCTSGPGIGQDQQWFNTGPYGGYAPTPYMVLYNDWAYNPGDEIFSYLTNFSQYNYWYNVNDAWSSGTGDVFPDVILDSPAGSSAGANPAFGLSGHCSSGQVYYYMNSLGFYAAPVPYPMGTPKNGVIVDGAGVQIASYTSDSNGQRGFFPKFARNQYGYKDLTSTPPNTWTTYVYYNDAQISKNSGDNCGYSNWASSGQRFSVTQITITQQ